MPPAAAPTAEGPGHRARATLTTAITSAASATATSAAVTASRVAPSDAEGATLPITSDPAVVLRAGDASPVRPNGKRKTSSAKSGGLATKAGRIATRAAAGASAIAPARRRGCAPRVANARQTSNGQAVSFRAAAAATVKADAT